MSNETPGVEIPLDHPVTVHGQEYSQVRMRRPKARDSRDAQRPGEGSAHSEIRLFTSLCDVPLEVIEEMDMADYGALQDTYRGFLVRRRRQA